MYMHMFEHWVKQSLLFFLYVYTERGMSHNWISICFMFFWTLIKFHITFVPFSNVERKIKWTRKFSTPPPPPFKKKRKTAFRRCFISYMHIWNVFHISALIIKGATNVLRFEGWRYHCTVMYSNFAWIFRDDISIVLLCTVILHRIALLTFFPVFNIVEIKKKTTL